MIEVNNKTRLSLILIENNDIERARIIQVRSDNNSVVVHSRALELMLYGWIDISHIELLKDMLYSIAYKLVVGRKNLIIVDNHFSEVEINNYRTLLKCAAYNSDYVLTLIREDVSVNA